MLIRDVILRDGSALRLRSPTPSDEGDIRAFFDALSAEDRYMRFHGAGRTDLVSRDYARADGEARVSLLAHLGARVVAVAGYDRLNEPDAAEVAFAVSDDVQGRGLATRMLEQLAEVAATRGITRFDAEVMGENRAMLRVFAHAGFDVRGASQYGIVHLALDLRPTDVLHERIADRTHAATVASLRPLLAPRSIAVVGASAREGSVGGAIFRAIVETGFAGIATPVNRDGGVVGSTRAVRSLGELGEPVDLVVVAVPAAEVPAVAVDAAAAGVRALLVVATGFSDTDEPEGRAREDELLATVRAHGLRLVGPNSLGVVNTDPAVGLRALIGRPPMRAGGLGLSSQSGALGLALLGHAAARRMGCSSFLALGNRADVSTNDVLEYFADDDRTTVVGFYVESFGNPRRFTQVARRVSRRKPILAVKGNHPTQSRPDGQLQITAALTDGAATEALFRQAGVLRMGSTQTLFDATELLERQPLPGGRAIGIVTNSGGLGTVAADAAGSRGLRLGRLADATRARLASALPQADRVGNPVDLGVRSTLHDQAEAVTALLADDGVDAVLVVHVGLGGPADDPEARLVALEAVAADATKPVVACVVGIDGGLPERDVRRVPNYRFPEAAIRALGIAAERRDWLGRRLGQVPELDGFDGGAAQALVDAAGTGRLDGEAAAALVRAAGVDVDGDGDGGGGVPATTGVAVLVGIVNDPELGPLVGVGAGTAAAGWVPLAGDVAFRLAPLTDVDAEELVAGTPALRAALAVGERDEAAQRDLVLRLSALADAVPELAEAELDGVLVHADGVTVSGARARLAPPADRARRKTW